jgi:hypothetical protein
MDQGVEIGVEMMNLSFGSGMSFDAYTSVNLPRYKEVADYGRSKGVGIGAYSLLASRGAATSADSCQGPGNRVRYRQ